MPSIRSSIVTVSGSSLRIATGVAAGCAVLVAGPWVASASAASYPPATNCAVSMSPTGSVTGTGFASGTSVTIALGGGSESATTNSSGSFSTTMNLPSTSSTLTASSAGCSATDSVEAANSTRPTSTVIKAQSNELPFTGAEVSTGAGVGALLLVAGGAMVYSARRRKA